MRIFLATIGLCAALALSAQQTKSLVFQTGYGHLRMLDMQVSPLIYKSGIVPLRFGYKKVDSGLFEVDFMLGMGTHGAKNFGTRVVNHQRPNSEGELADSLIKVGKSPIIQQELNISYLRKIGLESQNWQLYAGGTFKEFFSLSFTPAAIFMINEFSVGPAVVAFRSLSDQSRLKFEFSVPLTGFMVRLPYANDPADGKNGSFGSVYTMGTKFFTPLDYQRVNLGIGFEKAWSDKWSFAVGYQFYWLHYAPNRGITAYHNAINISLIKKLSSK